MLMLVEFDISADIIDVPQEVVADRKSLSVQFLKWLFSPEVKQRYTVTHNGHRGLCYRSEAFVDFINEIVLQHSEQKAVIVEQYVSRENKQRLPAVSF